MAVARLTSDPAAISVLGTPISTGFPWGKIETSGPMGRARLSFSAMGPKAEGTVYLDATRDFDTWTINRMQLVIKGSDRRINLVPGAGVQVPPIAPKRVETTRVTGPMASVSESKAVKTITIQPDD